MCIYLSVKRILVLCMNIHLLYTVYYILLSTLYTTIYATNCRIFSSLYATKEVHKHYYIENKVILNINLLQTFLSIQSPSISNISIETYCHPKR